MHGARRTQRGCIVGLGLAANSCVSTGRELNDSRTSLELGTGAAAFEPLEAGQHAKLDARNRGGHHVGSASAPAVSAARRSA